MYSQNKEEEVIGNYFGEFVGTFLDIGANDGITFSNVRRLAQLGWSGVCVEPSPKAFHRLVSNYIPFKNVHCHNAAIGTQDGTDILHESMSLVSKEDIALVSTFKRDEMDRFRSVTSYTPVTVQMFRWKTLLNRLKYKQFDFISIDVEGLDLDVLKQIDLTDTRMVCVEWNGKHKEEFTKACEGFRLIHENGENLIFAR